MYAPLALGRGSRSEHNSSSVGIRQSVYPKYLFRFLSFTYALAFL